jgi:hypothetical protein
MRVELPGLLRSAPARAALGDGKLIMDMALSAADAAFAGEVRAFLAASLPDHIRDGAARTPGVFVEPDIGIEWQRILHEKGWLAVH